MLSKKILYLFLFLFILYLFYIFVFYSYIDFNERDGIKERNKYEYLLKNSDKIHLNEVGSHNFNMKSIPQYKYAYDNPLLFKKSYLNFLNKSSFTSHQLDLILKLSCNLPPKNQLEFYKEIVNILNAKKLDKVYFEILGSSVYSCVSSGNYILPTGSYFWIPYLRREYKKIGLSSDEMLNPTTSFISGLIFYKNLGYLFGGKDS